MKKLPFVHITGRTAYILLLMLGLVIVIGGYWLLIVSPLNKPSHYKRDLWVTGYLPAYHHNGRSIDFMAEQDYQMLSHIAHASAIPQADGSLDVHSNSLSSASRQLANQVATQQQRPILLVLTGQHESFNQAIQPAQRADFIRNILQIVDQDGYDGVDIDMEPITRNPDEDNPAFKQFINDLHKELQARTSPRLQSPMLLTAAVSIRDRYIMAALADKFTQINLMSYDMAQPYEGWIPWFDSALDNDDLVFPGYSHEVPAIKNWVQLFLDAGVPREKLGIGLSFDVACWEGGRVSENQGVTQPRSSWQQQPQYFKRSYAEMLEAQLIPPQTQWDEAAQMAWFSVDEDNPDLDMFCNFNDAKAIAAKVAFAREQGLGGLIVWELGLDALHIPNQPNQARPLRQALETALQN